MLNCSIAGVKRQDGSPFEMADFMPYAGDNAAQSDDDDITVDQTITGFMAVLGAKKNG